MNEKTKTLKEQEDNMDISDGLYTGEESLKSKSPKTPPQQPGKQDNTNIIGKAVVLVLTLAAAGFLIMLIVMAVIFAGAARR